MGLVNEVKGTGAATKLSVYWTNGCMRKKGGGKLGCGTEGANERWKGDEVQRKEELTQR